MPLNSARARFGRRSGRTKGGEGCSPQPCSGSMWRVGCHRAPLSRWQPRRMRGCRGCLGPGQPALVPCSSSACSLLIRAQPEQEPGMCARGKLKLAAPVLPSSQKGCGATQRKGPAAQAVGHRVCHSSLKGFGTLKEMPSIF